MKSNMQGKALCFVTGHNRPAVAPLTAKYARTHPDGSPMLADGTGDTLVACVARWEAAQAEAAPKRGRPKKGEGEAAEAAESEA